MKDVSTQEILRKARRIEIRSRKLVSLAMAGEYRSVFRGTGVEFDSVREYVFGDDVRAIDWNVTARARRPYVKRFVESRERSVLLVVDRSASLDFGSTGASKAELAAELCAVLALAAAHNRDRVGLLQFSDRVEAFLPPGRGREWPHRLLRELLGLAPAGRRTDLELAIVEAERRLRRRAVVFLVSDFLEPPPVRALARLRRRHDVVALCVRDPREEVLAGLGIVECVDPESGVFFSLDAASPEERRQFERAALKLRSERLGAFKRAAVEAIEFLTGQDVLPPLLRFFEWRERRAR